MSSQFHHSTITAKAFQSVNKTGMRVCVCPRACVWGDTGRGGVPPQPRCDQT